MFFKYPATHTQFKTQCHHASSFIYIFYRFCSCFIFLLEWIFPCWYSKNKNKNQWLKTLRNWLYIMSNQGQKKTKGAHTWQIMIIWLWQTARPRRSDDLTWANIKKDNLFKKINIIQCQLQYYPLVIVVLEKKRWVYSW